MQEAAFTLIEIVVVVVIVGVLLAFAVPGFNNFLEKEKGQNGANNLLLIYHSQKRYKLNNTLADSYCVPSACPGGDITQINQSLGLNIVDPYFTYQIAASGTNGFTATATRNNSGPCAGKAMSITNLRSAITNDVENDIGCNLWCSPDNQGVCSTW
jgi:prepilin-type N-terminal cleavage/methylation domain-containing protein